MKHPFKRTAGFLALLGSMTGIVFACRSAKAPEVVADTALEPKTSSNAASDPVDRWVDCVGALGVTQVRGLAASNAKRFGEDAGTLRTAVRIGDLSQEDLSTFCDWEACIRSNGYAHACALNDAGWESCRVCQSTDDCDGRPMNHADCISHATDPGRSQCHVGLLQECLLQQAIRGPADACVTETCQLSAKACAGDLSGDLSAEALSAQHETNQISAEELFREVALKAPFAADPDAAVAALQSTIASWDGGASSCPLDAGTTTDGG